MLEDESLVRRFASPHASVSYQDTPCVVGIYATCRPSRRALSPSFQPSLVFHDILRTPPPLIAADGRTRQKIGIKLGPTSPC